MERSIGELSNEQIQYFKQNVFRSYLDSNINIRKTISNLINTFLRVAGLDMWPEILEILYNNLNHELGVEMCLETLNIIIEDSGPIIEEKYRHVKKIKNNFFSLSQV